MAFLYEKIDALREYGSSAVLPSYIPENLNPNFELRPYQKQAFENFITHFESSNRPKPTQVLFHMATGSGKTLIMAGLMLYLYKQGYQVCRSAKFVPFCVPQKIKQQKVFFALTKAGSSADYLTVKTA